MIDLYGIETSPYFTLMDLLDEAGETYTAHNDVEELVNMGFKTLPVLVVNGKEMPYRKALKWLKRKTR